LVGKRSHIGR